MKRTSKKGRIKKSGFQQFGSCVCQYFGLFLATDTTHSRFQKPQEQYLSFLFFLRGPLWRRRHHDISCLAGSSVVWRPRRFFMGRARGRLPGHVLGPSVYLSIRNDWQIAQRTSCALFWHASFLTTSTLSSTHGDHFLDLDLLRQENRIMIMYATITYVNFLVH